jgi:hypothetical protein
MPKNISMWPHKTSAKGRKRPDVVFHKLLILILIGAIFVFDIFANVSELSFVTYFPGE